MSESARERKEILALLDWIALPIVLAAMLVSYYLGKLRLWIGFFPASRAMFWLCDNLISQC